MYKRQNVVVHVQATITLQEEKFIIDADTVKVSSKGLILPCEPHVTGCETPHATYIWNGRDPLGCRTALTKTTSGVIANTDDEKEVFMSTDGEIECIGASYSFEGEWFTNVVVHVQATITLQEEKFLIDADSVKVSSKGLILPCEPHVTGCETPHATYIWNCLLYTSPSPRD